MKKFLLVVLILLFQNSFAKQVTKTEKLAATCKVWGFLKYYHPKVASGAINWDNELLRILPLIQDTNTNDEFSVVLEKWIDGLGPIAEGKQSPEPNDIVFFDKNFDLNWFNNDIFSKKLSKKLKFVEQNRFQSNEEFGPDFDVFKNGKYFDLDVSNKNNQFLMLFMYWNIIEYYFPYKYVMDQKWDKTLDRIIPLIADAKNEDDFYLAFRKMTTTLNDSHVEFTKYHSNKGNKYFPADCKIIDEKLVVTTILGDSLADADNIKVGDVITKINDKTIKELILENRELVCASNESAYLNKIVKLLLRSDSENVKVEFLNDNKIEIKMMTWFNYHDSHRNEFKKGAMKKKEKFKLLDNNIGYVDMGVIKPRNIPSMIDQLKSTKAIIFDMRNYPQNTWKEISDFLNPHQKVFCNYTMPYLNYPGRYSWVEGRKCGFENKDFYKGKVIVLLNEDSMSQAEWTAMCFQTAGNTTIIGSQTAGADGNVVELDFKGFHTRFSGIGVYYPDGRKTQRIGIKPDIEVKPTISGIKQGKDEVLDRALLFLEIGK